MNRSSLTRFAWLSIAAAILTIGLKAIAYQLTGSVGLLSDALESFVNLAGALMALAMLTIAARPALDRAVVPNPSPSPPTSVVKVPPTGGCDQEAFVIE